MAWLTGYAYRQTVPLKREDGAVALYQMKLNVHKGAGDSLLDDVYLKTHALSWTGTVPNDIRFTNLAGDELDYWIESSDANDAIVWIKFDSIGTTDTDFYIYYGKADDTTTSSGLDTFDLFDDFLGDTLDTDKWETFGTPTVAVSGGAVKVSRASYSGGWSAHGIRTKTFTIDEARLMARVKTDNSPLNTAGAVAQGATKACTNCLHFLQDTESVYLIRVKADKRDCSGGIDVAVLQAFADDTYYIVQTTRFGTSYLKGYVDGDYKDQVTSNILDGAEEIGILLEEWNDHGEVDFYVDWIAAAKFIDPEPTWGDWGEEQFQATQTVSMDALLKALDSKTADLDIITVARDAKAINLDAILFQVTPIASSDAIGVGMGDGTILYNGYIYITSRSSPGKVAKVKSDYSSIDVVEIKRGEVNSGHMDAIIEQGGYLWVGDFVTSGGYLYKLDPSDLSVVGYWQIFSAAPHICSMCTDGNYIYMGGVADASGCYIAKFKISNESITINHNNDLGDSGSDVMHSICESGDYLYGHVIKGGTESRIFKIAKSDLSQDSYAVITEICCDDIVQDDTYFYLLVETVSGGTLGVKRVAKSNLAISTCTPGSMVGGDGLMLTTGKLVAGNPASISEVYYVDIIDQTAFTAISHVPLTGFSNTGYAINDIIEDGDYVHILRQYAYTDVYLDKFNKNEILGYNRYTKTILMDALLRGLATKTTDVDILLRTADTKTADIDALVKAQDTKEITADLLLKALDIKTADLDALLRGLAAKTTDLDTLIRDTDTKTADVDAFIRDIDIKTVDLDALINIVGTEEVNLDALIRILGVDKTILLDTLLKGAATETVSIDTLVGALGLTKTVALDIVIGILYRQVNLDALLRDTDTKTVSLDTLIRALKEIKTVSIDTLIKTIGKSEPQIDALLSAIDEETLSLDILLRDTDTKQIALDILIRALEIAKTVSIDTLLRDTDVETADLDALVRDTDTKTVDLDALLRDTDSKTVDLDVWLRALDVIETVDLDTLVAQLGITKEVTIDALLAYKGTQTVNLDAFIQTMDLKAIALDILIRLIGETKQVSLDALIYGIDSVAIALDVIIGCKLYFTDEPLRVPISRLDAAKLAISRLPTYRRVRRCE